MVNTTLYANFIASILAHFHSVQLNLIYSTDSSPFFTLNHVRSLSFELQNWTLAYSAFYRFDLNLSEIFVDAKFINTTDRPIFIVLLRRDEALQCLRWTDKLRKINPSSKWVVFLEHTNLSRMDVGWTFSFDSEVYILPYLDEEAKEKQIIHEIYKKSARNSLEVNEIAVWDEENGVKLMFDESSLNYRRNHLRNITLRIAIVENPPSVLLDFPMAPTKLIGGYYAQIWNILEHFMEFKSVLYLPDGLGWGVLESNGKWNGMIGMLVYDKADIAIADFSMTPVRMNVVTYACPIAITQVGFFIRNYNPDDIKWTALMDPFHRYIWFSIIFLVVIIPIFSICLNYKNRDKNLFICYVEVLQIFSQQGMIVRDAPSTNAGYLFYVFLYYISILIVIAYSAALVGFLTIETFRMPFRDFKSFQESAYKLLVLAKSAKYSFFAEAVDPLIQKIYQTKVDVEHLPKVYDECMNRMCQSSQPYALFAPFYPVDLLRYDTKYCRTESIAVGLLESLSILAQKQSPYLNLINHNINRLRDYGILKRLQASEFPFKIKTEKSRFTSLTLSSVLPIFLVYLLFIGITITLLAIEVLWHKLTFLLQKRKQNKFRYIH